MLSTVLAKLGATLIAVGLVGLVFLALEQIGVAPPATIAKLRPDAVGPLSATSPVGDSPAPEPARRVAVGLAPTETPEGEAADSAAASNAVIAANESAAITRVVVPSISLDSEVVSARLVERGGATTWEVPSFKAGHAEHTAGAGEAGTAVLFGHIDSRNHGNVFRALDGIGVGDQVLVSSPARQFTYRVTDVRTVSRTDVQVLQPTETASVALVTCTGLWLPFIWDYTDRLVIQAELIALPSS